MHLREETQRTGTERCASRRTTESRELARGWHKAVSTCVYNANAVAWNVSRRARGDARLHKRKEGIRFYSDSTAAVVDGGRVIRSGLADRLPAPSPCCVIEASFPNPTRLPFDPFLPEQRTRSLPHFCRRSSSTKSLCHSDDNSTLSLPLSLSLCLSVPFFYRSFFSELSFREYFNAGTTH